MYSHYILLVSALFQQKSLRVKLSVLGNTRSSATAEKQRVSCPHGGG